MDFQEFVAGFHTMTSVMSVEKKNSGYGDIRIVVGNKKFVNMLENLYHSENTQSGTKKFIPNSLYTDFLSKDLNLEDLCYRSAVLKQPIHTYVHPNGYEYWFNIYVMPIEHEDGDLCYCTYSLEQCELTNIDLKTTYFMDTSADVLKTCIKLHDTKDFEQTMAEIIKDIRVICDAEVCTIMLMNFSAGTCKVLATNVREGSTLKRVTQFKNINFYDIAASWIDTIGESDCLIIKNEQDMKYISEVNNPWYLTLEEAGVDSVVMFPLRYNNEVLGYIWATNFDTKNTMRIKETLELTTFFLSSEIASYKLMQRLELISYTDLLTGVKNRNAMNNRICDIVSGAEKLSDQFGVIFADLNGLKRVNDSSGHSAGDLLLKKAALHIQEAFNGNEIYRAGGDEFMIIVSDCTEEEFNEKVIALKESSKDPDNVCFAIGSFYDNSGSDIRSAMRKADENMYKDKEYYYYEFPDRKHR